MHKTCSHSCYLYLLFFLGWLDFTTHALYFRGDNTQTYLIQTSSSLAAGHRVHMTQLTIVYTGLNWSRPSPRNTNDRGREEETASHWLCVATPSSDWLCVDRKGVCYINNLGPFQPKTSHFRPE